MPGPGVRAGEFVLNGARVSAGEDEKFLEMDGDNG